MMWKANSFFLKSCCFFGVFSVMVDKKLKCWKDVSWTLMGLVQFWKRLSGWRSAVHAVAITPCPACALIVTSCCFLAVWGLSCLCSAFHLQKYDCFLPRCFVACRLHSWPPEIQSWYVRLSPMPSACVPLVPQPPTITLQSPKDYIFDPREHIIIHCEAKGNPQPRWGQHSTLRESSKA